MLLSQLEYPLFMHTIENIKKITERFVKALCYIFSIVVPMYTKYADIQFIFFHV